MEAYSRTKCEAHGTTDCIMCAMQARKAKAGPPAPSTNPGAPPPDLEGLSTPPVADHLPEAPEVLHRGPIAGTIPGWTTPDFAGPATERKGIIDVLPTDDSHASQVLRAADAYAKAATKYAFALAEVEAMKAKLKGLELKLDNARELRDKTEQDLKHMTNEVIYTFKDVDDAKRTRMEAELRASETARAAELGGLR